MRLYYKVIALSFAASLGYAQLTTEQKVQDFQALSALYAKRYGPYEWKRDALKFDLMNIQPWLAKVQATKTDLDFYEVMVEYVSGLNDAHVSYLLPSSFVARLNFTVDVFEGKLLVDFVNRTRLPANEFGFQIGYELVSIDGRDAKELAEEFSRYDPGANLRSTRRFAAQALTLRPQSLMPHAPDVPEISTVLFRQPDGNLESHRIPWTRTGLPLGSVGTYFTPRNAEAQEPIEIDIPVEEQPAYLEPLNQLQNARVEYRAIVGFGALAPVFSASMPSGFTQRLGKVNTDPFYSGVFEADGLKIGFLRIPSYSPANQTTALNAFQSEIAFLQSNTDGLIVDNMRNPGGSVGYSNAVLSYLIPFQWRSIPFELRATSELLASISSVLEQVKAIGAPQSFVDQYQAIKDAIQTANRAMRGRTTPVPLDGVTIDREPARNSGGSIIAYTKPMIFLVDELSASGAEAAAATIQDNGRGPIIGFRTMGAGGNVTGRSAGTFSQGSVSVTESLMIRKNPIVTIEYPTAPYVENIGVRPDILLDYMTRENLIQNGRPFVEAFVAEAVAHIRKGN
jgi:hypothetical protein